MIRFNKKFFAAVLAVIMLFGNGSVIRQASVTAEAVTISEDIERQLISRIINAAERLEDTVDISDLRISKYYDFDNIFYQIIEDNPRLFYLSSNYYASYKNNRFTYFGLNFTNEIDEIEEMKIKFNLVTEEILSAVDDAWPDVMKALYLHDYIVLNAEYDMEYDEWNTDYDDMCYTAYGILVEKCGVCQGYSYAYKYLLQLFGIESEIVSSEEMMHVWNLVKIDGEYYHVDVTFDDTEYNNIGRSKHNNFMLSDKKIISASGTKHTDWITADNITADSTKYDNYFWRDIESAFLPIDQAWYFVDKNGDINAYDFDSNTYQVMFNTNTSWLKWGSTYQYLNSRYVRIASVNDCIIYNTDREIFVTDTDFNYSEKLYEADVSTGYIYGIGIDNGQLIYCLKTRSGEYEKKLATNILLEDILELYSPSVNDSLDDFVESETPTTYNYYNIDGELIFSDTGYGISDTIAPDMVDIKEKRFLKWTMVNADEGVVDLYPNYGVIGDADNDGVLTLMDVYCIYNYINGYHDFDADALILCDIDKNSIVDVVDCEMLLKYFAEVK